MAVKKITFTVTKSAGIQGYWLAVGNDDIEMNNDEGSIRLSTNKRHSLIWWMKGKSGDTLKIVGKNSADKIVVEIKKSQIPDDEIEGNGGRRFEVD